jgi:RNA polymerase sigma factor (sigma-70 family)
LPVRRIGVQSFPDPISRLSSISHVAADPELPDLLARLRGGDHAAADELLRRCRERLETMARAMLRRFPVVAAHEQTADVVQEVSLSLLAALRTLDVADTRAFHALAAEHVSRRLLDLARKHRRDAQPAASNPDADLDLWADLHEAAQRLPLESREVFALRFYHGWTLAQVAAVLGVSVATARRRWLEALAELAGQLRDLPE